MGMIITRNISALNTFNQLSSTTTEALDKLFAVSSNSTVDATTGLANSEKMRRQIHVFDQASTNAQHALLLTQTVEDALNEIINILRQMHELSLQAATAMLNEAERLAVQDTISALTAAINRVSSIAGFNVIKLEVSAGTSDTATGYALDLSTADKATAASRVIAAATSAVSAKRSKLSKIRNLLEHTINILATSSENLISAEFHIHEVDIASETACYTKTNCS